MSGAATVPEASRRRREHHRRTPAGRWVHRNRRNIWLYALALLLSSTVTYLFVR